MTHPLKIADSKLSKRRAVSLL